MKIAMMTNNYKPFIGGVPISVERLTEGLRALGHEVTVFAPAYEGVKEEENVVRCRSFQKKNMDGMSCPGFYSAEIEEKFQEIPFDVIHVHHPMLMGTMALYFGKKYRIPVVYTYHTRYEEYLHYFKAYHWLQKLSEQEAFLGLSHVTNAGKKLVLKAMKLFTNQCDLVFAPTENMKNYLLQNGTRSAVRVLPTGLDSFSYEEDQEKSAEIRKSCIKDKKFLLCSVSRLEKEKNMEFLIKGTARLKEKMGDCFRLLLIGDGNERKALEELCKRLGLEDTVIFVGKVPNEEIKNYQFASDLFLFASKSETQGIVLLEAMAAGNPVAAVKASGVMDVVKNEENGLMTAEDVEEWSSCIERVLSDSSFYKNLKEGARETARTYHADRIARQAEDFYCRMLYEREEKERWSWHDGKDVWRKLAWNLAKVRRI